MATEGRASCAGSHLRDSVDSLPHRTEFIPSDHISAWESDGRHWALTSVTSVSGACKRQYCLNIARMNTTHHVLHSPSVASPFPPSLQHLLRRPKIRDHRFRAPHQPNQRRHLHELPLFPMQQYIRTFQIEMQDRVRMLRRSAQPDALIH